MREIQICMGSSCFSRGNKENLRAVHAFLDRHGLSAEVRLVGHLCESRCSGGPNLAIDGRTYSGVAPERVAGLLERHLRDAS